MDRNEEKSNIAIVLQKLLRILGAQSHTIFADCIYFLFQPIIDKNSRGKERNLRIAFMLYKVVAWYI